MLHKAKVFVLYSPSKTTKVIAVDTLLQAFVSFKEIKSKLERGTGFYIDILGQLDDLSVTIDDLNKTEGPFPPEKTVCSSNFLPKINYLDNYLGGSKAAFGPGCPTGFIIFGF